MTAVSDQPIAGAYNYAVVALRAEWEWAQLAMVQARDQVESCDPLDLVVQLNHMNLAAAKADQLDHLTLAVAMADQLDHLTLAVAMADQLDHMTSPSAEEHELQ